MISLLSTFRHIGLLFASVVLSLVLINVLSWLLYPGNTELEKGLSLTQSQANIELSSRAKKPSVLSMETVGENDDLVEVDETESSVMLCFHTDHWISPETCSNRIPAEQLKSLEPLSGIGFVVYNSDTGELGSGKLVEYDRFLMVPSVSGKHSLHSMLRTIEVVAFNENPEKEVQLCAGTRKLLKTRQCAVTRCIEELLTGRYRLANMSTENKETTAMCRNTEVQHNTEMFRVINVEHRARWSALLVGWIQFLTMTLFSYLLIRTLAKYFTSFIETPKLKKISFSYSEDGELQSEISKIKSAGGHIQDRLYLAGLLSDSAQEARQRIYDKKVHFVELFDKGLDGARVQAENMLKLAFVGTILGISGALYAARNLDTANPIEKILVKSEMFSQIGAAFGTTLVGVILSIAIVSIIEALSSRSHHVAAEAYENIFGALSGEFAISDIPVETKERIKKLNDEPPESNVFSRAGGLVFFVLLIGLAYFVFKSWSG